MKNVLLIGLAKTGVSTIKYLSKMASNVVVNDIKTKEDLKEILEDLKEIENIEYILGKHIENVENIDLVVVSPGVPLDLPFIKNIKEKVEIIGEVELSYRLSNLPKIIGITGTNGKTTTTSLVSSIFKEAKEDVFTVGNIGNPVIDTVDVATKESVLVTELSSFQLESIDTYKPHISAILNFSEDHLNRHHTMEEYIKAKCNIYKNQDENDYLILNYDDILVRNLRDTKAKKIYFSCDSRLEKGVYLDENEDIIINIDKKINLMNKNELKIKGKHNVQNAMAGIAISYIYGIDVSIIKNALKNFSGVEHRQELVKNINGITFINDSKATNPDSSIKAINSYENIILIAGGMDKENDFENLLENAKGRVKSLVLLGETSQKIKDLALKKGFDDVNIVANMKEAVSMSYEKANEGDIVLLSPACASWDMYKSFEVRGRDFKENVNSLK